jgi:hypothetical protein
MFIIVIKHKHSNHNELLSFQVENTEPAFEITNDMSGFNPSKHILYIDALTVALNNLKLKTILVDTYNQSYLFGFYFNKKIEQTSSQIALSQINIDSVVYIYGYPNNYLYKFLQAVYANRLNTDNFKLLSNLNQIKEDIYTVWTYGASQKDFFTFLSDNKKPVQIQIIDYVTTSNAKNIYDRYPFLGITRKGIKTYLPKLFPNDVLINTVLSPFVFVSQIEWSDAFYTILERIDTNFNDQSFYNLAIPYYSQSKQYFKIPERFTDPVDKSNRIKIQYDGRTNIEVVTMIRNVHTQINIGKGDLPLIDLHVGDVIELSNQVHKSLDSSYYIYTIQNRILSLVTTIPIDSFTTKSKQDKEMMIQFIFKPFILILDDKLYLKPIDRSCIIKQILENNTYLVSIYLDKEELDQKNNCQTNPKLLTQAACESKFDAYNNLKTKTDIWDRRCEYDNDCPFFQKGQKGFRGGCIQGICELPIGYLSVGNRKYMFDTSSPPDPTNLRFVGSIFEPFISGIEPPDVFDAELPIATEDILSFSNGKAYYVGDSVQTIQNMLDIAFKTKQVSDKSILGLQDVNMNNPIRKKYNSVVNKTISLFLEQSGLDPLHYYIPSAKVTNLKSSTDWESQIITLRLCLHKKDMIYAKIIEVEAFIKKEEVTIQIARVVSIVHMQNLPYTSKLWSE